MNCSGFPSKVFWLTQWGLALLACYGWVTASLGQNANELINATIYDPFFKQDSSATHFRPIYISISLATPGAVAKKDLDFFAVHQMAWPYWHSVQRQRLTWCRFSLVKGQSSVDAELLSHSSDTDEYNTADTFFLETDGDLRYSGSTRNFAAFNNHRVTNTQQLDTPKFLFVFSDVLLEQFFTREIQVDLRSRQRTPGFEVMRRRQFSVTFPNQPALQRLPNVRGLNLIWAPNNFVPNFFDTGLPNPPPDLDVRDHFASSNFLFHISPKYFPTTWKGLVGFDIVVLNHRDLIELSQRENSRQIESLQKWIAAGGRLVVTNCGSEGREARQLEAALFEQSLGPDQLLWPSNWVSIDEGAKFPDIEKGPDSNIGNYESYRFAGDRLAGLTVPESVWDVEKPIPEGGVFFNHGLGRVIAWPGDAADLTQSDWKKILLATYANGGGSRLENTIGLGHLNHQWLGDFKLPGLGDPPHFVFLGLICLFALVVGPLAYWWFYRSRRLSFLLVVVPALSGVATTGLLLYAILASGLAFRSQRFSFTRLDHRSRTAVTVTEQAVFSGVSPKGYACNRDQFLFVANGDIKGTLQVQSTVDGHQFEAPEIRARTLHQVAAVDIQRTDRRLQVMRRPLSDGDEIEVKNLLGGPISVGYVRWQDQLYQFRNLEPDATTVAKPVETAWLESELRIAQGLRSGNKPNSFAGPSFESFTIAGTRSESWGLCQALARNRFSVEEGIKSGEYVCLLDNYDGAFELKPQVQYHSQLHMVHGDW